MSSFRSPVGDAKVLPKPTPQPRHFYLYTLSYVCSFSTEAHYINSALQRQAMNGTLFFCTAKMTMFATMITYVLEGHLMNANDIFVTFALYGSMRLTVTIAVPFGVQHASESLVALSRIQVS